MITKSHAVTDAGVVPLDSTWLTEKSATTSSLRCCWVARRATGRPGM